MFLVKTQQGLGLYFLLLCFTPSMRVSVCKVFQLRCFQHPRLHIPCLFLEKDCLLFICLVKRAVASPPMLVCIEKQVVRFGSVFCIYSVEVLYITQLGHAFHLDVPIENILQLCRDMQGYSIVGIVHQATMNMHEH